MYTHAPARLHAGDEAFGVYAFRSEGEGGSADTSKLRKERPGASTSSGAYTGVVGVGRIRTATGYTYLNSPGSLQEGPFYILACPRPPPPPCGAPSVQR
jgi:hypothetical protein